MTDIIVVHGTPGAGKSTHSIKLAQFSLDERPIFHISAGNRLRDVRIGEFNSAFNAEINNPNAPMLLDHQIVNGVIFEYISQCPPDSIVLVDGYPRFTDAIDLFVEAIKEGGHKLLGCINLSISLETCMSRLSGRGSRRGERIGNTRDFVEKRFSDHLTYTTEAVNKLEEIVPVINIDAESNEQVVWESVNEAVRRLVYSIFEA